MKENSFELDVRVHGHEVKEYLHEGKTYIEGREGSEFTLWVVNHTPKTVLAVVSVDGLSVMDGKDASFNSGGYVLKPYEKFEIPGWRLDLKNVAKFIFTVAGKSYAATSDKPKNVGVIGCAFFAQKELPLDEKYKKGITKIIEEHHHHYPSWPWVQPYPSQPIWLSSDSSEPRGITFDINTTTVGTQEYKGLTSETKCSTTKCSSTTKGCEPTSLVDNSELVENFIAQQVGTGFGQQASHEVNTVTFLREDNPMHVIEILYDSRESLVKRGVDLKPKAAVSVPQAFPGSFCTPPTGWAAKSK
jgi:hypothetical protein